MRKARVKVIFIDNPGEHVKHIYSRYSMIVLHVKIFRFDDTVDMKF